MSGRYWCVLLPFFSLMSFLIAVPTGIKFFNWIGAMWDGSITFETPTFEAHYPHLLERREAEAHYHRPRSAQS